MREISVKPQAAGLAESNPEQPPALKAACSQCHQNDMIGQQRLTRAQWDRELSKMTGWGAKVKDEDRPQLPDYLFANYGAGPRNR